VIRTLLVDDQQLVRAGLRMLCADAEGIEVVGEAGDGRQALALAEQSTPDVILMDLRMPGVDGVTATRRILAARPSARVLVLTTFDDDEHLYPALEAGACGFLAKDTAPGDLLDGIRRAADGRPVFSPHVLDRLVGRAVAARRPEAPEGGEGPARGSGEREGALTLTGRERQVLAAVAAGLSNAEIASRLHIGVTTVKTHIGSLMTKTGSRNRVQLAVRAHQSGLADDDSSSQ
jgi:DNA-binding NarL/FixJ family response regulator